MKRARTGLVLVSAAAAVLALANCTGGGGGSEDGDKVDPSQVALSSVFTALSGSAMMMDSASSDPAVGMERPGKSMTRAVGSLQRTIAKRRAARAAHLPIQSNCDVSGTVTEDAESGTTTYNDCINTVFGGIYTYQDGAVTQTESDTTSTFTSGSGGSPYILRMYAVEGATTINIFEIQSTLSMQSVGSGDAVVCSLETVHTDMAITMNGSMRIKSYGDTGALEEDAEITATNLAMEIETADYDLDTCEPTSSHTTMSGTLATTDHMADTTESISMPANAPMVFVSENMGTYDAVTVSGTMNIDSDCFDGTLTFATTTTIQIPHSEDDDACPTAGVLTVSGTITATITYNSNGSISIDNGSNGTVDSTLASCDDAASCS